MRHSPCVAMGTWSYTIHFQSFHDVFYSFCTDSMKKAECSCANVSSSMKKVIGCAYDNNELGDGHSALAGVCASY